MKGWRFALNRRWLGYLAMAVVFAIACVALSAWQLSRRDEAVAAMQKVAANYDEAPVSVHELVPERDRFSREFEWRPVRLTGRYLADEQLLARNRPFSGQPGFEVLTPLLLDDGSMFVVDRGWLPTGDRQDEPDSVPAPPSGQVSVVVRLKASEPALPGRSAPAGQVATIELPAIARAWDAPAYTAAYGLMATENPAPPERPSAAVRPDLTEGNHLSYAFQWLVFAIIGFAGLWFAIRQEYRIVNANDPAEQSRARARRIKAARREPSDADVEDSILDDSPSR